MHRGNNQNSPILARSFLPLYLVDSFPRQTDARFLTRLGNHHSTEVTRHLRVVQPEALGWSLDRSCWFLIDVAHLPGKYTKKISRRDRDRGGNGEKFCRGRFAAESLLSRDTFVWYQSNKDGFVPIKIALDTVAENMRIFSNCDGQGTRFPLLRCGPNH